MRLTSQTKDTLRVLKLRQQLIKRRLKLQEAKLVGAGLKMLMNSQPSVWGAIPEMPDMMAALLLDNDSLLASALQGAVARHLGKEASELADPTEQRGECIVPGCKRPREEFGWDGRCIECRIVSASSPSARASECECAEWTVLGTPGKADHRRWCDGRFWPGAGHHQWCSSYRGPPTKMLDCACIDWAMVGHQASAYHPSWHDGSPWPREHHPHCRYYTPPSDKEKTS